MKVHGIVWAGVRTDRFSETTAFFRDIVGLQLHELRDDFAWFTLPDSSQFEIFGGADPDHGHFTTGPVPSFHVGDVNAAVTELGARGFETFGPWGTPAQGWAHFRAPDGNVYGLSAGREYGRRDR
jgi:catechol 2,3-dioxygenase-like lactoylglutathione lyase family enzyme